MSAKSSPRKLARSITGTTDTSIIAEWLNGLDEKAFRDEILEHLFKKMLKAKIITWYKNIHGRNDKGVDFLLKLPSDLGPRVLGIQAKSKKLTRSSDGADSSALRIIGECEAATKHEFDLDAGRGKVDNIELWCSNHITEDAEAEFRAPGVAVNVRIQKASEVAVLIEKYCPDLLTRIPKLSLSLYIRRKQEPASKALRLLGAALNPKHHFLEPILARNPRFSAKAFKRDKNTVKRVNDRIKVDELIEDESHVVVVGADLSGKTYILERLDYLIAARGELPIFFPKGALGDERLVNIERLIAKQVGFLEVNEVREITAAGRVYLLIDNFHQLSTDQQSFLLGLDSTKYKVVAASTGWSGGRAKPAYIVGIDQESIPRFLRSIDKDLGERSFTDRAHAYINRTLSTSGLSLNPFTVAIMLDECQSGSGRFSTPTLGRLIERFIDLQLGSHSDYEHKVDFETKREFLVRLAGNRRSSFTVTAIRRSLGKFIERKSHPHTLDVFYDDLINSGVFEVDGDSLSWAHPVIAEYFWVRNLIGKRKMGPISKILMERANVTLAAIAGSQVRNAHDLTLALCEELEKVQAPEAQAIIDSVVGGPFLNDWADGDGEEELLTELEQKDTKVVAGNPLNEKRQNAREAASAIANSLSGTPPDTLQKSDERTLSREEKATIRKNLEEIFQMISESRFYLAGNISALLINARDTNAEDKSKAVIAIFKSIERQGGIVEKLINKLTPDGKTIQFMTGWSKLYFQLQLADRLLGDPFLINIFKKQLKAAKSSTEKVTFLDLLISCGEDDYQQVIDQLRAIGKIDVTFTLYLRMLVLYYYRYHKERDRKNIREFLKKLRMIHKEISLPLPN